MISRSNWASAPNRWNTNRPPAVVVSMFSRRDRNPTPRSSSPVTTSIRCRNDRPSRSSRHTTNVSPGRNCPSTASSCGRRSNAPDAWSVQTFQHPAAVSSSTCRSEFCSVVDTRA